ncbi:MAG: 2,3-bisphosphoglycerate-independent phosphoglycerate mutase [Clostridiales bacterium]|nr:2,3-bisphosphoglycerate-independent phosphoglycerate mutase [Clostridiales bacterium]
MIALIILDGYGITEKIEGNAVLVAKTPVLDRLFEECANTTLSASGLDVGLPEGQMGNSEVGHTNIGAGRVVYQELTRISKEIEDGTFYNNENFIEAANNCIRKNSQLHVMGLLSDGGVHSHIKHLYAILEFAKKSGMKEVYVHCFLDGRDVAPKSGLEFVKNLEEKFKEIGIGEIATVSGRYYAMDRDKRWDRVEKAYKAMVFGKCERKFESATQAIKNSYEENVTDEFMIPVVITKKDHIIATIKENDSIIFFNFRPDRAREITRSFVDPDFSGFKTSYFLNRFVCMTQYDANMPNVRVAFKPEILNDTLGEYLSRNRIKQLRIAETEKYAHVTFFFNGGIEEVYEGEDRFLVNSPKVATYDMQPGMSAYELTDEACVKIKSNKYGVIILNFANCDMVGHTGDFKAAVAAVETVDFCLGRVLNAVKSVSGIGIITSDHGNVEKMIDYESKSKFTAHTTNKVPFIIYGKSVSKLNSGKLSDIAPTIIKLMGLRKPFSMTGVSLIED